MKKFLLVLFLSSLLPFAAFAQIDREVQKSVKVHFRQGVGTLDENYMDNRATLKNFAEEVKKYYSDSTAQFRQIRVVSSVSPEGGKLVNERLAKQRAEAITNWISREISANLDYAVLSMGIDWESLISLVEADKNVPYREEVLDVLRNTPDVVVQDGKEVFQRYDALQQLRGGVPYKWIYSKFFPQLRYATARCEFWWELIPEIKITSASPMRIAAEGKENCVITFDKNVDDGIMPTVRSSADWVNTLIPTTGEVSFVVAPNPTSESRQAVVMLSCYDKQYPVVIEQYGTEPTMRLASLEPIDVPAEGTSGVIGYEKNLNDGVVPTACCPASWVEVVPTEDGIAYTVAPNRTTEPRATKLAVECYGRTEEIVIEQEGADPTLTITSASPVNYPAEGGSDAITYTKNVDDDVVPVATSSESWIESITPTEDGISYTVAPNTSEEARKANIVVDCYGDEQIVEVNQLGVTPECKRPFYMSIKTNMLYDVLAVPNIGAEFYLGKNVSIAGNWHYAWWKSDPKTWYWRTYGGDVSLRYWLGKESRIKPLTGHHIGVYGQMITYDFELAEKGVLADKWSWAAGVEYGYSLPIARRLNIDFTLGFGYHWGLFDEYLPIDGHYVWQVTKRRRYLGPTKLEVSLVWLIGCGNYNKDKGGRR